MPIDPERVKREELTAYQDVALGGKANGEAGKKINYLGLQLRPSSPSHMFASH